MKSINYVYYSSDEQLLRRLEEEYKMTGRDVQRYEDRIVVFALPRKTNKGYTTQSKDKKWTGKKKF